MLDLSDCTSFEELAYALAGVYSLTLCGGAIRLLVQALPGRTVCAIKQYGGILYVFVDLGKPDAPRAAWDMFQCWRASFLEPKVTDDGVVELRPLGRVPDPPTGPIPLSVGG